MSTNFPLSLDSYTDKIDNFHDVMAADVNNLQDAIKAIESLLGAPPDGWLRLPYILTYASPTTFTVPGDVTAVFRARIKIKLTQGGSTKYFFVVSASYSAPNTTVTIGSGGAYSLANEAISEPQVSYVQYPAGFPMTDDGWRGWYALPFTLTYVDAETITIAGDVTEYFPPHSKLKLTQGGSTKYFFVVSASYSSPNTTLVIGPWGLYSLANEAISEPQVSYAQNPAGFPLIEDGWLSYPTAWTYASANTFTVLGNVDYFFPVGAKIRLTQGGTTKYFYVVSASYSSPNTTVTVDGRGLYTLSNEAITNPRVALVQHPAGFPLVDDGWKPYPATWTYASATTFTVPGDVTAHFPVGAKIRLVQSGATKYFYVVGASYSSPNTTVTVTGGDDYILANEAISDPSISYAITPRGFPAWFNFAPTWSSDGTQPSLGNGTLNSKFRIDGALLTWAASLIMGSTTTYGTGNYMFTRPVAPAGSQTYIGIGYVRDAAIANYFLTVQISGTTPDIRYFYKQVNGANISRITPTEPITWEAGDSLNWQIQYGIG